MYLIKQVSEISGVSAHLHQYYDEIDCFPRKCNATYSDEEFVPIADDSLTDNIWDSAEKR